MKERGKYQIQCMKSRSSTGVGQKIDLEYNIETMRITDAGGEEGSSNYGGGGKASILDTIKPRSTLTPKDDAGNARPTGTPAWEKPMAISDVGKVAGDVQSNKLKQLLGQIKSGT
jgi:hypothetical protein